MTLRGKPRDELNRLTAGLSREIDYPRHGSYQRHSPRLSKPCGSVEYRSERQVAKLGDRATVAQW